MIDGHYPLGGIGFVHVLVEGRQTPRIRTGPFKIYGNGCFIKPEFFIKLHETDCPLLPAVGMSADGLELKWVRPMFDFPGADFAGLTAMMKPAYRQGRRDPTLFVVTELVDVDMEHVRLHFDHAFCGARSVPTLWMGVCRPGGIIHIDAGSSHHRLINRQGILLHEHETWTGSSADDGNTDDRS